MKVYLASTSPRRRAILRAMKIAFRAVAPPYEEEAPGSRHPRALVRMHALEKASAAARSLKDGVVIGADTVVAFRGRVIGKPKDRADAERTLGALAGKWHTVYTGTAILAVEKGRLRRVSAWVETTRVRLKKMDRMAVRAYFRRVNPLDKAGSYAIQSRVPVVERVKGSFFNAMGLPAESLAERLDEMGFRRKR